MVFLNMVRRLSATQRIEKKESKKRDARALFYIQQALDETLFPRIMGVVFSNKARELLRDKFKGQVK